MTSMRIHGEGTTACRPSSYARSAARCSPTISLIQLADPATPLALWRQTRFREERYGAIALTGDRWAAPFQTLETLPVYAEMIVTGACWNYVDDIATPGGEGSSGASPSAMTRRMRAWSRTPDIWKRRSAILCQIIFKADTDLELARWSATCGPMLPSRGRSADPRR
jgi:hypothetical protein